MRSLGMVVASIAARGASGLSTRGAPVMRGGLRTAMRSTQTDGVTGTKFEEEDEKKNPEKRGGHQVTGMAEVDEETAARMAKVRAHQETCTRLSWPEEIRTMLSQKEGFGTLSTLSSAGDIAGFPSGSVVGFAVDDTSGRPIFCFSAMSGHTKNLNFDARASLCVTEETFEGAADARAVLTGKVTRIVDEDEDKAARAAYTRAHAGAFWAQFGDFKMYRMDEILDISFVGGFARAGTVTPAEYMAAKVDVLADFAKPVMQHMNDDHEDALKAYATGLVGCAPLQSAQMKRLDTFGFDVRVVDEATGSKGVLRVPFDAPVTDRKGIKTAIVALSSKLKQEA